MNNIIKIFRTAGAINFVIQTEGESDFWVWQISAWDWFEYFGNDEVTEDRANKFINDEDNATLGCSSASYDTIEDAVADWEE